jgi:hypothetical protein
VEDKVAPTLHHIVAALLAGNTHTRLLIEFPFGTLYRKFIAVTVSLWEGPFLGTSPFNKKDVSKRV